MLTIVDFNCTRTKASNTHICCISMYLHKTSKCSKCSHLLYLLQNQIWIIIRPDCIIDGFWYLLSDQIEQINAGIFHRQCFILVIQSCYLPAYGASWCHFLPAYGAFWCSAVTAVEKQKPKWRITTHYTVIFMSQSDRQFGTENVIWCLGAIQLGQWVIAIMFLLK